ncbi:MAG: 3-isopropylmalate dehydratase small subunit [Acidimicrobiia bacterium]|nr:3-isopropylmalate dehydratase small subunit [Acidimicrobiia bacterium]NNL70761.1 3-isopropylmalate dehydratase small subunit [Acidimicrobiia bacterium]
MEPVRRIEGTMAPLMRSHVDTDQIIPKQFLKRVERTGFGPFLFYDWAYDHEGELRTDFILNQPEYENAAVLISGPNFGSGSSREHAPWALLDAGFQAVIAPSFGDIFRNNSFKNGLVPIILPEEDVSRLAEIAADPAARIAIDIAQGTVTAGGQTTAFYLDPFVQHCLLNGLDDIAITLESEADISTFEGARPGFKPSLA